MTTTEPAFAAELLPDCHGLYGIRHSTTGQWIARWDGAPASWASESFAKRDVGTVSAGLRPRHCLDRLAEHAAWNPVATLTDQIRARLDDPADVALNGTPYVDAIRATVELHREHRIYEPCGHTHQPGEPGVQEVDDVGVVCEDGYIYSICWCCCTGETGFQSESCASNHEGCWPCETAKTIARALGLLSEVTK